MHFNFLHLDLEVRNYMRTEFEQDVSKGFVHSKRLSEHGLRVYPELFLRAFDSGNEVSLAQELRTPGIFKRQEERRKPSGGMTVATVPVTAPDALAESEFNRYYIRAICLQAISIGQQQVEVYRAKEVDKPRPESTEKIGTLVSAVRLLEDLRSHVGIDTALGVPSGPNSGLSIRFAPSA